VSERRASAKSRCQHAEKIQNFSKAFCSGKQALQQNERFGRRHSLPFILNNKTENPISKSLFETEVWGCVFGFFCQIGTKKEGMFLFVSE